MISRQMTKIHLKRKKQNAEAVKVSTSRNAVDVDGTEVDADCKSLNEENWEEINGELLDQDIAEVKFDEQKKVEDFQCYKEVEDVEQFRISSSLILWEVIKMEHNYLQRAFKNLKRFQVTLQQLMKVF
jgi:hypothetical protein